MEINALTKVCKTLNIPSVPNKEWDGKKSFKEGVAIIELIDGTQSYAISSYNKENDSEPKIKQVFSIIPFKKVLTHYPLPQYMDTDVENFDLSDEDKKKAKEIINEAKLEESKTETKDNNKEDKNENEYLFNEIHNDDEAKAFIKSYNKKHGIAGKLPQTHETIVLRLTAIFEESK